jgi:N-acetylglucosaminyl-diphospho-decaprenol L-rhamnosyltransferase
MINVTKVDVIILNWNTRELVAKALHSLPWASGTIELEVLIVDNGSTDGSVEMIRSKFPSVRVFENRENLGFAKGNNLALQHCSAEFLLLLNSDAELKPGALEAMVALLKSKPSAGLIGARILNQDCTLQASFVDFPTLWREFLILSGIGRAIFGRWYPSHGPRQNRQAQPVDYVSGACLLLRREACIETGGFDESFFMYAEEVDLCYRLKEKGWQVWYQPDAEVIHVGGGSSHSIPVKRETDLYQSRVAYFNKHYGRDSAIILAYMIIVLSSIKFVIHSVLSRVSRGKYGRQIVSPRRLATAMRDLL